MKVLGTFLGEYNARKFAIGGYVALDATRVAVKTYTGAATSKDNQCYLELGTDFLVTTIKKLDGGYLAPYAANELVKQICTQDLTELDRLDCAFFDVYDLIPDR